jgi:hypothetical protein
MRAAIARFAHKCTSMNTETIPGKGRGLLWTIERRCVRDASIRDVRCSSRRASALIPLPRVMIRMQLWECHCEKYYRVDVVGPCRGYGRIRTRTDSDKRRVLSSQTIPRAHKDTQRPAPAARGFETFHILSSRVIPHVARPAAVISLDRPLLHFENCF